MPSEPVANPLKEDRMPTVSVLIPTCNYAHFLPQAIDSVLAQTVPPQEIIVADDGSTDRTADVVARYGPAVRYLRREHAGVFTLRQAMLAEIRGDWFLNLDADDWIEQDFLEKALAAVRRSANDERLAFVYADRVDFGAYERTWPAPEFEAGRFKQGNFVAMDSLVRTDIARRFGFDPAFNSGWGDYDFFLTLAKNGFRGERLADGRIHCRVHPASITEATAGTDRKQKLMRQIVAKHGDFFSPEEGARAIRRFAPEAVLRHRLCEQVWAGNYRLAAAMFFRLLATQPRAIFSLQAVAGAWRRRGGAGPD
jgi:glycosyltransferase involved in cell wall biosynthesis